MKKQYPRCKSCRKEYDSLWRKKDGKWRERDRKKREVLRAFMLEYLHAHPCVDCGINDIRVLEFDHVRGEKKGTIGYFLSTLQANSLKTEIEKCEVVCANCHRIRTYKITKCYRTGGKIEGKSNVTLNLSKDYKRRYNKISGNKKRKGEK